MAFPRATVELWATSVSIPLFEAELAVLCPRRRSASNPGEFIMQAKCARHDHVVGTSSSQESVLGRSALLVSIVVVLLLAGCGIKKHASVAATVRPTLNSTESMHAEQQGPVTIQVVVLTQQGTLAADNVVVTAHVIVTNHTTRPIWLWDQCPTPDILMTLTLVTTPNHTIGFGPSDNCILGASITLWHQGTLDQVTAPGSTLLYGSAQGQTLSLPSPKI